LADLDIDWEAPLVNSLGDVAGHQLAEALRSTFAWGKQASASLTRQLQEFIQEEARLSPPRLELEDFYRDVQDLGLRVDRLQSRTERLRQRLQKLKG
jgi:ubiquinone biosynthesis protein UbiJ